MLGFMQVALKNVDLYVNHVDAFFIDFCVNYAYIQITFLKLSEKSKVLHGERTIFMKFRLYGVLMFFVFS